MSSYLDYKYYRFWLVTLIISSFFLIWYIYKVIFYKDIFAGIMGVIFLGLMIFNYSKIKTIKKIFQDSIKLDVIKGLK